MIYGNGPYAEVLRAHTHTHDAAWIAQQTPVENGQPQSEWAFAYASGVCETLPAGTLVVVSTQLPVGSCARLEARWPALRFAVQPENVRVATAHQDFLAQRTFVVGSRHPVKQWFDRVLPAPVMVMSPESAEMTKHALNGYLALCVRYGNEIGRLCEAHNADPADVLAGMRADRRVGSAPVAPGDPPSEHLLREVHTLIDLGAGPIIEAIL